MNTLHTATLDCSAMLVVEPNESVNSAAISWLIPAGSAHDQNILLGQGTVTSEMLMRGTERHDSRAQADAFDRLGASRSCSAGSRFMTLGATMLGDRAGGVLELLAEMVLAPRFDTDAVGAAKDLALQAIASLQDDPQQRAVLGARKRHHRAPFDRSGMGTPEGIAALTRDGLADGWHRNATPVGSIIAVAGRVEAGAVEAQLNKLLAGWSGDEPMLEASGAPERGYAHEHDESNQVQIVVVHDGPLETDDDAILEKIVVEVLSGGMSARLFTEVREKRGLCYAVHAGYRASRDIGAVTGYVGTTPERAQESLDVLVGELRRINETGIEPDEFERALVGMKSRLVFSGESTGARAGAIASDLFNQGRPRTLDERMAEYEAMTLERLNGYLKGRELGRMTVQTVGPVELSWGG